MSEITFINHRLRPLSFKVDSILCKIPNDGDLYDDVDYGVHFVRLSPTAVLLVDRLYDFNARMIEEHHFIFDAQSPLKFALRSKAERRHACQSTRC